MNIPLHFDLPYYIYLLSVFISRKKLLHGCKERQDQDGLTDLKYKVLEKTQEKLFTYIFVDIGEFHPQVQ